MPTAGSVTIFGGASLSSCQAVMDRPLPTLYAFEIQISNEMIKAIYPNTPEQLMMLEYALAQAVKGGVIAAGAGAVSVLAPLAAKFMLPVGGDLVGRGVSSITRDTFNKS